MKRFRWILALAAVLIFCQTESVQALQDTEETAETAGSADKADELVKQQAEALETDSIGEFWDDIMSEYGGLLPESQKGSLLEFMNGEKSFSPQEWLKALFLIYFMKCSQMENSSAL